MNQQQAAMQQALEALEHSLQLVAIEARRAVRNDCADATINETEKAEIRHRQSITALRAALEAQQAELVALLREVAQ